MKSIFITGVDTDIGKTFVSLGLCLSAHQDGLKVGYFKPFQSGAYEKEGKLIAPDLYELEKFCKIPTMYSYLFKGEVSPHLASIIDNVDADINKVKNDFDFFSKGKDLVVIEGAGGLYCPAIKGKLCSDVIKELNQEIIIVTTPALGRLNHTLMTIECEKINNINIKGIIINKVPKNKTLSEENFIKELKMYTNVEILGVIPEVENKTIQNVTNVFQKILLNV